MKTRRTDVFNAGSTLAAWGFLGLLLLGFWFFQGLEKPATAALPNSDPGPVTQLTLEQLPVRDEIQPEILPEPEVIPEPEPERDPVVEPDVPAIEELPPSEEPEAEPDPEPVPASEPEAVAQEAGRIEAGGAAVPPSLLQELERIVFKAKYYPTRAKRRGITGRVVLRITISVVGVIDAVEIVSSDHLILASAAKKTGDRLLGKMLSPKPRETLRVDVPVVYELR